GCNKAESRPRVVLSCAQDQEFAEGILAEFERRTGIEVATKYDTEADKSVSLYYELVTEKEHPRCDVFWNNEVLSTIRLQRQGLLPPVGVSSPSSFWTAFAMRARVLVVNSDLVPEPARPRSIMDLTKPQWKGKVAMARPQFGTSATQA